MVVEGHEAGAAPTYREMAETLGLSKPTIFEIVQGILKKGYLQNTPNHKRSLAPIEPIATAYLPGRRCSDRLADAVDELKHLLAVATRLWDHLDGCSHGYPDGLWEDGEAAIHRAEALLKAES